MDRIRQYTVYKHTNTINNKVYIGITSWTWQKRWRTGYKKNTHFRSAILKYGEDVFTHEILFEGLSKTDACRKEIELIQSYKSSDPRYGYNISHGGDLLFQGLHHTPEAKLKISIGNKGKTVSDSTKQKISQSNKGKHSMPHPWAGSFKTGNTYNTLRKNKRGGNKKRSPVSQYSKEGVLIATYPSIKEAAIATGGYANHISECLKGTRLSAKNFIWKRASNP